MPATLRTLGAALIMHLSLFAESKGAASFGAPVLGYGFDAAAGRLERLRGIAGAAAVDRLTGEWRQAAVSSAKDFALGVDVDGAVHLLRFVTGSATPVDVPRSPERMILSPSGTAAALLYAREIRIIAGLPNSIEIRSPLPVSGAAGAMTVDDTGTVVLAAFGSDEHSRLVRITAAGEIGLPFFAGAVSALAFRPGSLDAALAGGGRLTIVRDALRAPVLEVLADGQAELNGTLALSFSADAGLLAVAQLGGSSIQIFSLNAAGTVAVHCGCAISTLERLNQNGVFRLNSLSEGTPMLLDVDSRAPRVVFAVPGAPLAELTQ